MLDGDPAPPPRKGEHQPPTFWPMSVVAKWSPISGTSELLYFLLYYNVILITHIHYPVAMPTNIRGGFPSFVYAPRMITYLIGR